MGKNKLISFADGRFANRAPTFFKEAKLINLYDEINIYNFNKLSTSFSEKHGDFIRNNSKGFGYWIWKPQIVLQEIQRSHPDDTITYIDIGFSINSGGRDRAREYIDIVRESKWKMLSFSNTYREYLWTKYDLAARIGVENRMTYMGTTQLAAGCFSLKPTSSNIDLLNEWISISCEDNYRYLDETESKLPNHKQFIEHRHDASISSLLRKKRGTTVTHYEVQKYDNEFEKSKLSFPFYAHRLTK